MEKWRNFDVHQSVEQKYQLVDIEFLVSLLEPKIIPFPSFGPDTFMSNFSKKTISRDLLTQKLTPNRVPEQKYFLGVWNHYAPLDEPFYHILLDSSDIKVTI